jgi:hypothetical protein
MMLAQTAIPGEKTSGRWALIERYGENRAGGIRTHDLLNPIQAHYQAVLRPDDAGTIHSERGIANELFPVVIPSEVEGSRDVTLSPISRDDCLCSVLIATHGISHYRPRLC